MNVVFLIHDENQEWDQMMPVVVKNGYDLWYEKSDNQRLLVKCCNGKKNNQNKGCPFRLWATWMSSEKSLVFQFGSIVTYKWIGTHFMRYILHKPKMSTRKLKAKVSKKFNLIASVGQCRSTKKYAFKEIEGSLKEHYAKTWSYGEEIKRTNPRSTMKMDVDVMPDGTTYFSKFYVCLKGLKDGCIEGCKRGICRGKLLSVVGRDANNHIYLITWAMVAVESKETWKWFIELFIDDLGMGVGHGLTLIQTNTKKLFWYAVVATTQENFEQHMNEIKKLEPLAYDHLMERGLKTWSTSFFQTDRACDAYENGISDSFNSAIQAARKRPLMTMLEEIRIYVMERICKLKSKGQYWDLTMCPSIRLKLAKLKEHQKFWKVVPSGYQQFKVRLGYDAYAGDLGSRTCACRGWKLTGYPCMHAYACISSLNRDAYDYVSPWFTTTMFLSCYRYTINPLNGSDMWLHVDYIKSLPPKRRRIPGRPSTKKKEKVQIEKENQGRKHSITKKAR
uniref:SWIM-type domain-containing protein n=1 Tax=Lactuca sativa TaxID=4236 RepID=A0A9R1X8A4_LACSA|nr:hypothetical protein LSAT_V11C600309130 [Lactuca sativa]